MSTAVSTPLQVGDRVEGVASGHLGTVTAIHDGGDHISAKKDDGPGWNAALPRHRFLFVSRPSAAPKLKAGDTVKGRSGLTVKVMALDDSSGMFWGKPSSGSPLTYRSADFEKVEPFFEVGKTYTRPRGWSIMFQNDDVVEEFEVVRVDTESRANIGVDRKVAYGKLVLADTGEYQWWTHKGSYGFDRWTEVR